MNAPQSAQPDTSVASVHILPLMAGKAVFAIELRRLREAGGMTRAELSRQAHIPYSRLGAWEYGVFLSTKSMRAEVEALDRLVSAGGKLTALWRDSAPGPECLAAKIYRLPSKDWPKRLRDQWQRLFAYRITNPEELPRSSDARWNKTTINAFLWFIKAFMGFLVNHMNNGEVHLDICRNSRGVAVPPAGYGKIPEPLRGEISGRTNRYNHGSDRQLGGRLSRQAAPKSGLVRLAWHLPLAATALPVEAFVAFGTIAMSPVTVPVSMIIPAPVGSRTPMAA